MSLKLVNGPGTTRHVYYSGCGRIRLVLTIGQAHYASHPGDCTQEVAMLAAQPEVASQLAEIDREHLRADLRDVGAWTDEELAVDADNLLRFLWEAANHIAENPNETTEDDND